jgi:hypothetical protein
MSTNTNIEIVEYIPMVASITAYIVMVNTKGEEREIHREKEKERERERNS